MGADLVLNLFLLGQDDVAYALLDGLPDKPQEQSGGQGGHGG